MLLYDPADGQMRIAVLMSGSGTIARKIIELEEKLKADTGNSPYKVAAIFTDSIDSRAAEIGREYDIPVLMRDKLAYYARRNRPVSDMDVRREFDEETVSMLKPFGISAAAYAGYMSIATPVLVDAFLGINVHPADLRILKEGARKYTGAHAVRDEILAGEQYLRATTHIISSEVDHGELLMISSPVEVRLCEHFNPCDKSLLNNAAAENQSLLKQLGDWVIFPLTLLYLSQGRYSRKPDGLIYFDEDIAPVVLN
jgi:folate-dependent phosphoribosylglycinamide formyltransferase PurN